MKKFYEQIIEEASKDQGRRNFLKTTGLGALCIAGLGFSLPETEAGKKKVKIGSRADRLKRMASNSYAVNTLFKRRVSQRMTQRTNQYKEKYGETTLLDFPRFTRDTYPGVYAMDLWSSLFGDVTDDSMFTSMKGMVRSAQENLIPRHYLQNAGLGSRMLI